ncbi:hypothetical protein Sango_2146700 [Sesamum angolense]|uniref:DNA/RNA-binding protein Alba-like domain-containing protein n=1 Tax=Sesamum angolense TaxID=2727404 RepID=A0AAE1WCJ1_9LAMI|nr:hypothetical protein Sango_2146700 [Sesamum angolense]
MDRYQKVEKPKVETPIDENEIRITSQGRMRSYITYAMSLLQMLKYEMFAWVVLAAASMSFVLIGSYSTEKGSDDIVFKAMGRAINKTVTIVELIKRRIVGLHQIIAIQSTDITDTWEPLEEGLQTYQPPIPADQVKVPTDLDFEGEGSPPGRGRGRFGRGRGRPRVPSGNGFASSEFEDGGYERNRGYARGRGRGRGRSFRGRGRGGYNGPQVDAQYDAGGYNQEAPRGRGRGRGIRGRGRGFRSNGLVQAAA